MTKRLITVGSVLAMLMGIGMSPARASTNDDFSAATLIDVSPFGATNDTSAATVQTGEPQPTCSAAGAPVGHTVWYAVALPSSLELDVSTAGSKFDSVMSLYSGTDLGTLTEIACNDDSESGSLQARVSTFIEGPATVLVQIGGYKEAAGFLKVASSWKVGIRGDDFAHPVTIGDLPAHYEIDNTAATVEPGEPSCYEPDHTIWFRYTAPVRTGVRFDFGSSYIPAMATFYTGSSLNDLTQIGCADVYYGNTSFAAEPGQQYYIQLGSDPYYCCEETETGLLILDVTSFEFPANDDFAGAISIGDAPSKTTGVMLGSTTETSETLPCSPYYYYEDDPYASVWYSYTPSETADLVVSANSDYEFRASYTQVAVYTGDTLGDVSLVGACGGFGGDKVAFRAEAGTTYHIQVMGYPEYQPEFQLTLRHGNGTQLDPSLLGRGGVTIENEEDHKGVSAYVMNEGADVRTGEDGTDAHACVYVPFAPSACI